MTGDFNVKLVDAYNAYVAIYRFKREIDKLESKVSKIPRVRFLELTGRGELVLPPVRAMHTLR